MKCRSPQQNKSSLSNFQILEKLGDGAFSQVFKVTRISDGQIYALKKVKLNLLNQKEKENSLNEVRILASIKDKHIVGYKECFVDNDSNCLCLVLQFCDGGDVLHKIQSMQVRRQFFPENDVWKYLIQMIKGLNALHKMNILHRDLKCANVFLTKHGCVLGDLNVSKVAKNKMLLTQTGTPYYASPEVWRDESYDLKSDIWSLGCVIYEIIALKPPFRGQNMNELFRRVQKGVFDPIPACYSKELGYVVSLCLQVNPKARPTCNDLLSNAVIRQHDFDREGLGLLHAANKPSDNNGNLQCLTNAQNQNSQLLQTILLTNNLSSVNLPPANYQQSQVQQQQLDQQQIQIKKDNRPGSAVNGMAGQNQNVPISPTLVPNQNKYQEMLYNSSQQSKRIESIIIQSNTGNTQAQTQTSTTLKPIEINQIETEKPSQALSLSPLQQMQRQRAKAQQSEQHFSQVHIELDSIQAHNKDLMQRQQASKLRMLSEQSPVNKQQMKAEYINNETLSQQSSQQQSVKQQLQQQNKHKLKEPKLNEIYGSNSNSKKQPIANANIELVKKYSNKQVVAQLKDILVDQKCNALQFPSNFHLIKQPHPHTNGQRKPCVSVDNADANHNNIYKIYNLNNSNNLNHINMSSLNKQVEQGECLHSLYKHANGLFSAKPLAKINLSNSNAGSQQHMVKQHAVETTSDNTNNISLTNANTNNTINANTNANINANINTNTNTNTNNIQKADQFKNLFSIDFKRQQQSNNQVQNIRKKLYNVVPNQQQRLSSENSFLSRFERPLSENLLHRQFLMKPRMLPQSVKNLQLKQSHDLINVFPSIGKFQLKQQGSNGGEHLNLQVPNSNSEFKTRQPPSCFGNSIALSPVSKDSKERKIQSAKPLNQVSRYMNPSYNIMRLIKKQFDCKNQLNGGNFAMNNNNNGNNNYNNNIYNYNNNNNNNNNNNRHYENIYENNKKQSVQNEKLRQFQREQIRLARRKMNNNTEGCIIRSNSNKTLINCKVNNTINDYSQKQQKQILMSSIADMDISSKNDQVRNISKDIQRWQNNAYLSNIQNLQNERMHKFDHYGLKA